MPISASSWIVLQSSMLHIMVCGYQQIAGYADAPRVEALRQGTTLHKIIMQFKGWELARCCPSKSRHRKVEN